MLKQEFLKNVDSWNGKGIALRKQGKFKEAIECHDEALKLDPKQAYAWYNKGNALQDQGKLKEAIECFDEALKLYPKYDNAWNGKGIALKDQGKLKEAIECFDEALKLDPKEVNAWNNKGDALRNQGKLKEAIECFDEALKLDPKYVDAWNNKGFALYKLSLDNQGKFNAWFGKGLALRNQGKLKEAIECYDEALKLDPKYVEVWNGKGCALDDQGKLKEAIECYDEALKLDPKHSYAWNNKGFALYKQGKLKEAIECFDETLKLDPKYIFALNNKALALDVIGKFDEAEKYYLIANEMDQNKTEEWVNMILKDNKIEKGKLFLSKYNKNATTGSEVEVLLKDIKLGEYIDVFDKLGVKTINDILLLVEKDWESLHVIPYHQKKILQAITDKGDLKENMSTKKVIDKSTNNASSATHNSIRLLDAPPSSSLQFNPIYGIADIKVTSLIEAIKPLASTNLVKHIDKYTQDALKLFSKNPLPTPLDLDETVAIHLYTKEWPEYTCSLYYVLNAQLRSKDRRMIKPFYPYIKILLMGLNKLEKTPGVTYRGVGLNLSKDYNIGEEIEWWAFTSTTTDGNACQGFLEKSPEKTLFRLEQKNGVNIQKFSQYPSESEVLLCPMKVLVKNKFKVVGLWIVELEDLGISLVNL